MASFPEKVFDHIMPSGDGTVGTGLGYACVLLQTHLGLRLATVAFPQVLAAGPALAARIKKETWEATLLTAAGAVKPAPVIAVFALLQALGGATDILTWIGLLLATFSVLLGAFAVVFATILSGAVPEVNMETGDIMTDDSEGRLNITARLVSGLRALGMMLMIFGAPPAGAQLLIVSALVRVALAIHSAGSLAHALKLGRDGSFWEALSDADYVVRVAPLIACLALLDHAVWGEGSLLFVPLQPTLYGVLACFVQVGLVFTVQKSVGARVDVEYEGPKAEFDVIFALGEVEQTAAGSRVEAFRGIAALGLYSAMALSMFRAWVGSSTFSITPEGICMPLPDPLRFAASALASVLVFVLVAEYLCARPKKGDAEESEVATEDKGASNTFLRCLKGMVGNVMHLVLAFLAVRASLVDGTEDEGLFQTFTSILYWPFRYGLILAGAAIFLQIAAYVTYALAHADSAGEEPPPFDECCILDWQPAGQTAQQAAKYTRWLTLLLLEGGLSLGLLGMGVTFWAFAGVVVGPVLYCLLPAEAKSVTIEILGVILAVPLCAVSFITDRMEAMQAAKAMKHEESLKREEEEQSAKSGKVATRSAEPKKKTKGPAEAAPKKKKKN